MPDGSLSHRRVDASMSVNRNVTVPVGAFTTTKTTSARPVAVVPVLAAPSAMAVAVRIRCQNRRRARVTSQARRNSQVWRSQPAGPAAGGTTRWNPGARRYTPLPRGRHPLFSPSSQRRGRDRAGDRGGRHMFTGLIREVGHVVDLDAEGVVVAAPKTAAGLVPGGSVCVSGVCLTAID